MRKLFFVTVLAVIEPAETVLAQRVEFEFGGGYVVGGGMENPGPSLPALDVGLVFWPAARWGVAVRLVEGPGEDLHEPVVSSDRTFLGTGHLHYWTATVRRRAALTSAVGLELGFGLLFNGRFSTVQVFHDPPRRSSAPDNFFDRGGSLEAFVTRSLGRNLGIKGGVTFDFNLDTTNFQPIAVGVIRF